MKRLGAPAWFQLGDRDLATHLRRTELLASGSTLADATRQITRTFGVQAGVLPMTDARVETRVLTPQGELSFQEYFVRERWQVAVTGVRFDGAERAAPAPGVVEAILAAEVVLVAPSNPVTSIGPILSVPGIRDALRQTAAPIAAVSPIVGGAAVSGPAGELMSAQRLPVSPAGVAQTYADFLDVLVVDEGDAGASVDVPAIEVRVADTIMKTMADTTKLARTVLDFIRKHELKAAS
jgi:LPPG:FO 2-phospho-L-lactate transferase